jgi:hypothetical protein
MSKRISLTCASLLFAAMSLLLLQPGKAQAHPILQGKWFSVAPANAITAYEFGPGDYLGAGIWKGTYTVYLGNDFLSCGTYELRMVTGTQGTIGMIDGQMANARVATIDVGTKTMTLYNVTFRP